MSRTIDNLTVREKIVTNEIQSIFNSSVNQRSTNIQADNISCNTISYVNGPVGGGAITSTEINTTTYNITSIDYTYYFIKKSWNFDWSCKFRYIATWKSILCFLYITNR